MERFHLASLTCRAVCSTLRKRVRARNCRFSHFRAFDLIMYNNMCSMCTSHRSACCDFPANSQSRYPVSPAQISEMMSHFLKQQGYDHTLASGGELLPTLKSVCGQVSKLRLDGGAMEAQMTNGTW